MFQLWFDYKMSGFYIKWNEVYSDSEWFERRSIEIGSKCESQKWEHASTIRFIYRLQRTYLCTHAHTRNAQNRCIRFSTLKLVYRYIMLLIRTSNENECVCLCIWVIPFLLCISTTSSFDCEANSTNTRDGRLVDEHNRFGFSFQMFLFSISVIYFCT